MSVARLLSSVLAASLLTGAATAQSLGIDVKLVIPTGGGAVIGTIPSPPNTEVSLAVSGGAAFGQAFVAFAGGVVPPLPTPFGDLVLNPASLTSVGAFPLDGTGFGSVKSSFGVLPGSFQQAFQVAVLDPALASVSLTGAAQLGYGASPTLNFKARIAYGGDPEAWKVIVTNKIASSQPVVVEHFDASTAQTTTLAAGTLPPGAFPGVSFLELTGALALDEGDAITVSCAGTQLARLDG